MFSTVLFKGTKLGEGFPLASAKFPPEKNFSQQSFHQASRVFLEKVTCYGFYILVFRNLRQMKQVNGYVQEPMAAPQTEVEQEVVVQEDHPQINSTAHVGTSEAQEFSLAIKPKGPPLFKLRIKRNGTIEKSNETSGNERS
ncbi:protein jagunal [Nephila pilipes]|uniref:Protein jagunal n=1 Tax=Nephila pilipes TaxID=299642 RepID=A0A8X6P402_NEPPI|nr:protein jagunal [Nephila pilipes]